MIVVTDHGHRGGGGHGGRSEHERAAWVACCGPGIPAGFDPSAPVRHADIAAQVYAAQVYAAQVYAALNRTPDSHWTLDGRPFK